MSTVVITGANRGLGLELARAFVERGDAVIAGCRNLAGAVELAELGVRVAALDVGDESSIERFVSALGDQQVDVLINNAGIDARNLGADDSQRDVLLQTRQQFLGQIEVNAVGPWLLSRALLPSLRQSPAPKIVNMSSQVGSMEIAPGMGRDVGYAASKAALNMITIKLAVRLRDEGIVVVALHPGHLRTSMGGASAPVEAGDAAHDIVDLIESLTIDDTGTFRRWDGSTHPW